MPGWHHDNRDQAVVSMSPPPKGLLQQVWPPFAVQWVLRESLDGVTAVPMGLGKKRALSVVR